MYDHRARSIFKLYIKVIVNGLLGYSINIYREIKWIRTGRASVLYWNIIHGQPATASHLNTAHKRNTLREKYPSVLKQQLIEGSPAVLTKTKTTTKINFDKLLSRCYLKLNSR